MKNMEKEVEAEVEARHESGYIATVYNNNTLSIQATDLRRGMVAFLESLVFGGKMYTAFPHEKSDRIKLDGLTIELEERSIRLRHPKYGTHSFGSVTFWKVRS